MMNGSDEQPSQNMDPQDFLKKFYPGGFFGNDRDGRPVFYEPLGQVDFWGILHTVKTEEIVKYKREHCELAKTLWEEQEKKLDTKIEQYSTLVLDAQGGDRKHLWKPGLDAFKATVQLYDKEYPELRKRIIVIRAPSIFPILFSLLKPFLRESTKQKIKVAGSDWQDVLKKYIDPDQIPVYYGGTAKDGSGNEKCELHIGYGGDVPTSYFTSEKAKQAEFVATVIKAGSKLDIEFEIQEVGRKISYQFVTSDYDIEFSISRKTKDSGESEKGETVLAKSRKQSHIMMEEDSIECTQAGIYVFTFNNAYSWLRDKKLFYNIKDEKEEIVQAVETTSQGEHKAEHQEQEQE